MTVWEAIPLFTHAMYSEASGLILNACLCEYDEETGCAVIRQRLALTWRSERLACTAGSCQPDLLDPHPCGGGQVSLSYLAPHIVQIRTFKNVQHAQLLLLS